MKTGNAKSGAARAPPAIPTASQRPKMTAMISARQRIAHTLAPGAARTVATWCARPGSRQLTRSSEKWRSLYCRRPAVEREFERLKHTRPHLPPRPRDRASAAPC